LKEEGKELKMGKNFKENPVIKAPKWSPTNVIPACVPKHYVPQ